MERQGEKRLRKTLYFKRSRDVEKAVIGDSSGDGMGCTLDWEVSLRKHV